MNVPMYVYVIGKMVDKITQNVVVLYGSKPTKTTVEELE